MFTIGIAAISFMVSSVDRYPFLTYVYIYRFPLLLAVDAAVILLPSKKVRVQRAPRSAFLRF